MRIVSSLATLVGLSVACAVALGLAMNTINGLVSPDYFEILLGRGRPGLRTALLHGIFRGAAHGLAFAAVAALVIVPGTHRWVTPRLLIRSVLIGVAAAVVCVAVGAAGGFLLATCAQETYLARWPIAWRASSVPGFAFVGGSHTGAMVGIPVAVVAAAAVSYRAAARARTETRGFAVGQVHGEATHD